MEAFGFMYRQSDNKSENRKINTEIRVEVLYSEIPDQEVMIALYRKNIKCICIMTENLAG